MSGHDRLTPEGEKFLREINELKSKKVFVGFQSGEAAEECMECMDMRHSSRNRK